MVRCGCWPVLVSIYGRFRRYSFLMKNRLGDVLTAYSVVRVLRGPAILGLSHGAVAVLIGAEPASSNGPTSTRQEIRLDFGWSFSFEAENASGLTTTGNILSETVSIPHTWNAADGAASPSHLAPYYEITPRGTPELAAACRKLLDARGDDSTGSALAWRMNLWARRGDAIAP